MNHPRFRVAAGLAVAAGALVWASTLEVDCLRLARIDDSLHFIQMDQPARFVTEVDAFMRPK